jgi:hypothetical protein
MSEATDMIVDDVSPAPPPAPAPPAPAPAASAASSGGDGAQAPPSSDKDAAEYFRTQDKVLFDLGLRFAHPDDLAEMRQLLKGTGSGVDSLRASLGRLLERVSWRAQAFRQPSAAILADIANPFASSPKQIAVRNYGQGIVTRLAEQLVVADTLDARRYVKRKWSGFLPEQLKARLLGETLPLLLTSISRGYFTSKAVGAAAVPSCTVQQLQLFAAVVASREAVETLVVEPDGGENQGRGNSRNLPKSASGKRSYMGKVRSRLGDMPFEDALDVFASTSPGKRYMKSHIPADTLPPPSPASPPDRAMTKPEMISMVFNCNLTRDGVTKLVKSVPADMDHLRNALKPLSGVLRNDLPETKQALLRAIEAKPLLDGRGVYASFVRSLQIYFDAFPVLYKLVIAQAKYTVAERPLVTFVIGADGTTIEKKSQLALATRLLDGPYTNAELSWIALTDSYGTLWICRAAIRVLTERMRDRQREPQVA